MFDTFLHKFYDASISIGTDGTMLLVSTRDRFMIWAATFCFVAAICLGCFLLLKNNRARKACLLAFLGTLFIPLFIIPAVRQEYIHVSPQQITVEQGAWILESRTILLFQDLDNISEQVDGIMPSNLLGDPDVSWHFLWKDGRRETLELNDFFNAHRMVVAYYIKDRGYRFERLEDRENIVF
ncbi:MAG: hypothetical protein A3J35_06605 [Gammaproteobacteria bacterium RIFCSPLOWO2_02_FULL_52_10]|nr:MAG: hypothetical protein A3J35_06605 [Gammaproteobacteria bacterium RIFCSPLOWO2_02_FULL_52_10]